MTIALPNDQTLEMSTVKLLRELVLSDEKFGVDLARVRMSAELDAACEEALTSGYVEISPEQHALVCDILERPSKPYNPLMARRILGLITEILGAKESSA